MLGVLTPAWCPAPRLRRPSGFIEPCRPALRKLTVRSSGAGAWLQRKTRPSWIGRRLERRAAADASTRDGASTARGQLEVATRAEFELRRSDGRRARGSAPPVRGDSYSRRAAWRAGSHPQSGRNARASRAPKTSPSQSPTWWRGTSSGALWWPARSFSQVQAQAKPAARTRSGVAAPTRPYG